MNNVCDFDPQHFFECQARHWLKIIMSQPRGTRDIYWTQKKQDLVKKLGAAEANKLSDEVMKQRELLSEQAR